MYWPYLFLVLTVHGLGVWMAVDVVMKGRTAQGTIAWSISLLLMPWLSLPFYLVLGDRKFIGYERASPEGSREIDVLARALLESLAPFVPPNSEAGFADRGFTKLARFPFTSGNKVTLLINGSATFDAILEAVESAREYIVVQFYIVRDDGLGKRLQRALLAARKRGVRVYLLYDEIGSHGLPRAYLQALKDAGCECSGFRTKARKQRPFRLNFRNHRKIVVVDGRVAFTGGHNVGDEYLGLHKVLTPWRDTHVSIRGPAVQCVQLAFVEDWFWATQRVPGLDWTPRASGSGDACVLIVPSSPADEFDTASLLYTQLADGARSRLWLSSAYFVPDEGVVGALQLAALRGVDVGVVMPEKADSIPPQLSSFTFHEEMFPAGVKIYCYQSGFPHQKVALSDDVACVGTANLDNRSFRLNFEISVLVSDTAFAAEVADMLTVDISKSRLVAIDEFQERPYWFRLCCRVSRLLAPIQ